MCSSFLLPLPSSSLLPSLSATLLPLPSISLLPPPSTSILSLALPGTLEQQVLCWNSDTVRHLYIAYQVCWSLPTLEIKLFVLKIE